MPREIKRSAKIRAAVAEQKRLRRARMTEEELKQLRAVETERARQQRAKMTEAELIERRAKQSAKQREKRLTLNSEALQELQKIRDRDAEWKRRKRAAMNEEEREKKSAEAAELMRRKKTQMTEEELKKLNAKKTEYNRQKRARWTEEKWQRFKAVQAGRKKLKENGTAIEKIRHMASMVVALSKRHPARYEIVGTDFKNSLSDILNLYTEVAALRKNFKKTVSEAVQNVVSVHRIEKQLKTVGYQSLTFVELPPPSNLDCDIKQEFNARKHETDPFLVPLLDAQSKSFLPHNENPAKELADETLQIISHDEFAASDRNCNKETSVVKIFVCSICSKKFATSLGLTIHQTEHKTNSGEFKCGICPQMFNDCNLMTTHYLQDHSLEFDANAVSIEIEAEEADEVLERHRHEFEFSLLRKCLVCFQTFDRPGLSTYSHHVISDHSENKELLKYFTYSCARCDKPHAVLRSLECHWKSFCYEKWKTEYFNNGGIVCEKCGMRFSNEKSLSSHSGIYHVEKQKIACEQCGKEFDEKLLKIHVKAVHETHRTFICEQCGNSFKSRPNLIKHTKIVHLGEKHFDCKLCSKRFDSKLQLFNHTIITHKEKAFRCKYCVELHASKITQSIHEGNHEGTNKQSSRQTDGNYECDMCGKPFKSSFSLNDNKFSHDDHTRFGCSLCDKTFRHKNNFYRHKVQKHKASENAQIVKLTSGDVFANLLPKRDDVSETLYNAPEMGTPTFSNMRLEPQYSLGREDYSPEMDYDNDINVDDISLPQFQTEGLRNVQCAMTNETSSWQNNTSLNRSNNAGRFNSLQNSIFDTNTEDLQRYVPTTSSFIDFSRANVPSVLSTLTKDTSNIEVEESKNLVNQKISPKNEQKSEIFVENWEKNSFVAEFDLKDLAKIKMETFDGVGKEHTKVSDENEASIFVQNNSSVFYSSSNNPIVKLTRLLEHHCVPCDKTIFAVSQREIRKHRRTHLKKESKKRSKYTYSSGNGKWKMNSFDCLYCEKKNLSGREIVAHCSKEHPGLKPLRCKQCPWMSNTIDTYYNHKKKHNAPKPKLPRDPNAKKDILCEVCGKAFYSKEVMWSHRSTMHRREINVQCDICHKMIRGKGNLRLHKQRHLEIKPHLCEECGMSFVTPNELKHHVRLKHTGEKSTPKEKKSRPFLCNLCPYTFVKEVALQKHMPLHDPQRKYSCDECGFRFNWYNSLFSHRKVMHKNIKPKRKHKMFSADAL